MAYLQNFVPDVYGSQEICPHCETDLRGDPIPEEHRHLYGGKLRYSHGVAVEIPGVYDGALFYACPRCNSFWHRFEPQHGLHARAQKVVEQMQS